VARVDAVIEFLVALREAVLSSCRTHEQWRRNASNDGEQTTTHDAVFALSVSYCSVCFSCFIGPM